MSIRNQQIGWSQESKLWWEVLKGFNKLEQTIASQYGKAAIHTPNAQIGWKNEEYLLREIAKKVGQITQLRCSQDSCITTTSTTTTIIPTPTLKINPPSVNTFDIPAYVESSSEGDFTIEWLQNMHTDDGFPRIYSLGQFPAENAVSIEGGTLYLWLNGSFQGYYYLPDLGPFLDEWIHIVVTRNGDQLYVWANGINLINITFTAAIPANGNDLYIGSENASSTYYNGLISNFRWCIGDAVYGGGAPSYPTNLLDAIPAAVLLIGQGTDLTSQLTDQTGTNTITNTQCTYNTDSGILGYNGSLQFGTI